MFLSSHWISASAGTGKTKAIIDRMISLVLSGAKLDKIFCVTLTKVAALEVERRLFDIIDNIFTMNEEQFSLYCYQNNIKLNCTFDEAIHRLYESQKSSVSISTIHSYCLKVLKKYYQLIELNNLVEVQEESYIKYKVYNAIEEVLFSDFVFSDTSLIEFVNRIGIANIQSAAFDIFKRRYFIFRKNRLPISDRIVHEVFKGFDGKSFKYDIIQDFLKSICIEVGELKDCNGPLIEKLTHFLLSDEKVFLLQDYLSIFITSGGVGKKLIFNKSISCVLKDKIIREQSRVLKYLDTINSFIVSSDSIILSAIVDKVISKVDSIDVFGFDDVIDCFLSILLDETKSSKILYDFFLEFDHIILDESQDFTYEQWRVITLLIENFVSSDKTFFCVGDPKQSIYRFLGVSYEAYAHSKNKIFDTFINSKCQIKFSELNMSYRSVKVITDFINLIFQNIDIGCKFSKHNSFVGNCGGTVKVFQPFLIEVHGSIEEEFEEKKNNTFDKISDHIVKNIADIFFGNNEVMSNDIMILVRKRSAICDKLFEKISAIGIPVSHNRVIDDEDYFKFCIYIVKFIVFRDDHSALNIFHFLVSDEFFFDFERDFIDKEIKSYIFNYSELSSALFNFLNKFSISSSFIDLFYSLFEMLDGIDKGIYLIKYVEDFLTLSELAFKDGVYSILDMYDWYKSCSYKNRKLSSEQNKCGVNIMTIHSAKGLQSDSVFLIDDGDYPSMRGGVYYLKDFERSVMTPIYVANKYCKNERIGKMINEEKKQLTHEYNRLLYVAISRAKRNFYLYGIKKGSNYNKCWHSAVCDIVGQSNICKVYGCD